MVIISHAPSAESSYFTAVDIKIQSVQQIKLVSCNKTSLKALSVILIMIMHAQQVTIADKPLTVLMIKGKSKLIFAAMQVRAVHSPSSLSTFVGHSTKQPL